VWFLLELADAAWALITTVMGDLYRWDGKGGRWKTWYVRSLTGFRKIKNLGATHLAGNR